MKIDAHQHFWQYNPQRDRWINEEMSMLKHDFLPENLLPILQQHQFDGCVAVQADSSEKETIFLLELAIVIGKKASYVSLENAEDYIAGYVLHNDVSERAFQIEKEGQWCKGKGCDTFAPLGPFLATKDEIKDPNNLHLWLEVNGERLQDSSTSDFIFNVQEVVSYISQYMTLLPGDVISTGTPFGVGLGFHPPKYLKPGDVMRLGIEGLGVSEQKTVGYL